MSDDKIEEIRARHSVYPPGPNARHRSIMAYRDIATLLAEVYKLRADSKRMHKALYRIAGKVPFADDPWTIARKALEGKP